MVLDDQGPHLVLVFLHCRLGRILLISRHHKSSATANRPKGPEKNGQSRRQEDRKHKGQSKGLGCCRSVLDALESHPWCPRSRCSLRLAHGEVEAEEVSALASVGLPTPKHVDAVPDESHAPRDAPLRLPPKDLRGAPPDQTTKDVFAPSGTGKRQ